MKALALLAFVALSACTTALPPTASCAQQWSTWHQDRTNGFLAGGLIGVAMSGNKPTCPEYADGR